jgi:hypothetical protein
MITRFILLARCEGPGSLSAGPQEKALALAGIFYSFTYEPTNSGHPLYDIHIMNNNQGKHEQYI